jgi:hypothetical protein
MRNGARPAEKIKQQAIEAQDCLLSLETGKPSSTLWSERVTIDLRSLYGDTASLDELPLYLDKAREQAGEGNEVIITGQAPVWLYLAVAHALHGRARRLVYVSPVAGEVTVFDHSAG